MLQKSSHSIGLFATAYIFDTDVKKQMLAQKKVVSVYKDTKKTFFKVSSTFFVVLYAVPYFKPCAEIFSSIESFFLIKSLKCRTLTDFFTR